ncbi:MAG: cell division protein ZipA C-terminal FtsZ-binding domain-containing protein [Panacagrimonas sp.]
MQWALLVLCVVLVIALYILSRRGKSSDSDREERASASARLRSGDQLDLLGQRSDASFDELGVGRPRKRGEGAPAKFPAATAPQRDGDFAPAPFLAAPSAAGEPVAPRLVAPLSAPQAGAATAPSAEAPPPRKPVALIIAPSEETDILGPALHEALLAQGLRFGANEVYHRMIGGQSVYSIASLIKPGTINPAQAAEFSTKGLLLILNLPGPVVPVVALDDLVTTARGLAAALRAEIFDGRRQRLTDDVAATLRAEVETWAKANKLG